MCCLEKRVYDDNSKYEKHSKKFLKKRKTCMNTETQGKVAILCNKLMDMKLQRKEEQRPLWRLSTS